MTRAMFSLSVEGTPPKWTCVCDRCGCELDIDEPPLMIVKIRDLDDQSVDVQEILTEKFARMRDSASRMMIIDMENVEIKESQRGLGDRILKHLDACGQPPI